MASTRPPGTYSPSARAGGRGGGSGGVAGMVRRAGSDASVDSSAASIRRRSRRNTAFRLRGCFDIGTPLQHNPASRTLGELGATRTCRPPGAPAHPRHWRTAQRPTASRRPSSSVGCGGTAQGANDHHSRGGTVPRRRGQSVSRPPSRLRASYGGQASGRVLQPLAGAQNLARNGIQPPVHCERPRSVPKSLRAWVRVAESPPHRDARLRGTVLASSPAAGVERSAEVKGGSAGSTELTSIVQAQRTALGR